MLVSTWTLWSTVLPSVSDSVPRAITLSPSRRAANDSTNLSSTPPYADADEIELIDMAAWLRQSARPMPTWSVTLQRSAKNCHVHQSSASLPPHVSVVRCPMS